jgi:cardiolipin synthase
MIERLEQLVAALVALLVIATNLLASCHALLFRRDVRATISWVGFIWLVPMLGPVLYLLFGINRIRRRAQALGRNEVRAVKPSPPRAAPHSENATRRQRPTSEVVGAAGHLSQLVRLVDRVVHQPLLPGNLVEPLICGDQAFPRMLAAIDQATSSLSLSSYIFDADRAGRQFVEALARAVARGVEVRVLVDAAGARYGWPPIHRLLKRARVPVARFLPTLVPRRFSYLNLRNHRKLMIADGRVGFTGGMNIREGNLLQLTPPPRHPIRDLHACLTGPVVAHLQQAFVEDWAFASGEQLAGERWFPSLEATGPVFARGVPDGPDEHFEQLRLTFLGALSVAQRHVRIATPYFLPEQSLTTALNVAAMRGVEVEIVIPAQSNLRLVQWATWAQLWQVLERGCKVWLAPPPFDHTKLMTVDDAWTLLGSGNWDARSLRLNFEFNVECYDHSLAGQIGRLIDERISRSRRLTIAEVDGRPLPVRLRDAVANLMSPYL